MAVFDKTESLSAFEPGASGLPYSLFLIAPPSVPVCVSAVLVSLAVWIQNQNKK